MDDYLSHERESIITKLKRAWINEKNAPELLQYEDNLVDDITSRVKEQEDHIAAMEERNQSQFVTNLQKQQLDRVKYYLRSYLRIRLIKIEKFCNFVLSNDEEKRKLSRRELEFAEQLAKLVRKHFHDSFLQFIPENMRSLTSDSMVRKPNVDVHVICTVNEFIGELQVDEESEDYLRLEKNEKWLLPYKPIQQLLAQGKLDLI